MNKLVLFLFLFFVCPFCIAEIIQDEVANELPRAVMQPCVYEKYNFESTEKVPILVKVVKEIKSESDIFEGQFIDFKVIKDVIYKHKIIAKRGDIITARVSVIVTPGMNGIPASIVFKEFSLEGISKTKLTNTYEVFGQNRSLLVFPLKWALTILPPSGSLTNFIMGGHAKLNKKKIIILYYYPNWK